MNPADPCARLFEFIQSITPAGSFNPDRDQMESVSGWTITTSPTICDSAKGLTSLIERFRR